MRVCLIVQINCAFSSGYQQKKKKNPKKFRFIAMNSPSSIEAALPRFTNFTENKVKKTIEFSYIERTLYHFKFESSAISNLTILMTLYSVSNFLILSPLNLMN